MEDESSVWREWTSLKCLASRLPCHFQHGFSTSDLVLTSISSFEDHLILGTNVGLVYLIHLPSLHIIRLKCERVMIPVSCVAALRSVDDLVGSGSEDGCVTVFLLPRVLPPHPNQPPPRAGVGCNLKRFSVSSLHSSAVTSLAWSRNGLRLVSGDDGGGVGLLEVDYDACQCVARHLLREPHPIVQLSYLKQSVAVSTEERCVVYSLESGEVRRVGSKPRKTRGRYGAVWAPAQFISPNLAAASVSPPVTTAVSAAANPAVVAVDPVASLAFGAAVGAPVTVGATAAYAAVATTASDAVAPEVDTNATSGSSGTCANTAPGSNDRDVGSVSVVDETTISTDSEGRPVRNETVTNADSVCRTAVKSDSASDITGSADDASSINHDCNDASDAAGANSYPTCQSTSDNTGSGDMAPGINKSSANNAIGNTACSIGGVAPSRGGTSSLLYCARPGQRVWSADSTGTVSNTMIIKQVPKRLVITFLDQEDENIQRKNNNIGTVPDDSEGKQSDMDMVNFELLKVMDTGQLVMYSADSLVVFNPMTLQVEGYLKRPNFIRDVSISGDNIFILNKTSKLFCISKTMPNIGTSAVKLGSIHAPTETIASPMALRKFGSKLFQQGSNLLDSVSKLTGTIASKVSESAAGGTIVTGYTEDMRDNFSHNINTGHNSITKQSVVGGDLPSLLHAMHGSAPLSTSASQEHVETSVETNSFTERIVRSLYEYLPTTASDNHPQGHRPPPPAVLAAVAPPLVVREKTKKRNRRRREENSDVSPSSGGSSSTSPFPISSSPMLRNTATAATDTAIPETGADIAGTDNMTRRTTGAETNISEVDAARVGRIIHSTEGTGTHIEGGETTKTDTETEYRNSMIDSPCVGTVARHEETRSGATQKEIYEYEKKLGDLLGIDFFTNSQVEGKPTYTEEESQQERDAESGLESKNMSSEEESVIPTTLDANLGNISDSGFNAPSKNNSINFQSATVTSTDLPTRENSNYYEVYNANPQKKNLSLKNVVGKNIILNNNCNSTPIERSHNTSVQSNACNSSLVGTDNTSSLCYGPPSGSSVPALDGEACGHRGMACSHLSEELAQEFIARELPMSRRITLVLEVMTTTNALRVKPKIDNKHSPNFNNVNDQVVEGEWMKLNLPSSLTCMCASDDSIIYLDSENQLYFGKLDYFNGSCDWKQLLLPLVTSGVAVSESGKTLWLLCNNRVFECVRGDGIQSLTTEISSEQERGGHYLLRRTNDVDHNSHSSDEETFKSEVENYSKHTNDATFPISNASSITPDVNCYMLSTEAVASRVLQVCGDDDFIYYIKDNHKVYAQQRSGEQGRGIEVGLDCGVHYVTALTFRGGLLWAFTTTGDLLFRIGQTRSSPTGYSWGVMRSEHFDDYIEDSFEIIVSQNKGDTENIGDENEQLERVDKVSYANNDQRKNDTGNPANDLPDSDLKSRRYSQENKNETRNYSDDTHSSSTNNNTRATRKNSVISNEAIASISSSNTKDDTSIVIGVCVGGRGVGWRVTKEGKVEFRPGVSPQIPQGANTQWWEVVSCSEVSSADSRNIQLASTSDHFYVAEKDHTTIALHRLSCRGTVWDIVGEESWSLVSAESLFGRHGSLALLDPQGHLMMLNPNTTNVLPLPLPDDNPVVCVAQRPEALWMITAAGDVWLRVGLTATAMLGSHWHQLDLYQISDVHLCQLSLGVEVVWALDTRGGIYMRQGTLTPPHPAACQQAWLQVDSPPLPDKATFTKVFCGPECQLVWAVDSRQRVYVRVAIYSSDLPTGVAWEHVPGVRALHLSISECGGVYAVTVSGELYRRQGVHPPSNYVGTHWTKVAGGCFARISVSVDDRVWGLTSEGRLCRHNAIHSQRWKDSGAHAIAVHRSTNKCNGYKSDSSSELASTGPDRIDGGCGVSKTKCKLKNIFAASSVTDVESGETNIETINKMGRRRRRRTSKSFSSSDDGFVSLNHKKESLLCENDGGIEDTDDHAQNNVSFHKDSTSDENWDVI